MRTHLVLIFFGCGEVKEAVDLVIRHVFRFDVCRRSKRLGKKLGRRGAERRSAPKWLTALTVVFLAEVFVKDGVVLDGVDGGAVGGSVPVEELGLEVASPELSLVELRGVGGVV